MPYVTGLVIHLLHKEHFIADLVINTQLIDNTTIDIFGKNPVFVEQRIKIKVNSVIKNYIMYSYRKIGTNPIRMQYNVPTTIKRFIYKIRRLDVEFVYLVEMDDNFANSRQISPADIQSFICGK